MHYFKIPLHFILIRTCNLKKNIPLNLYQNLSGILVDEMKIKDLVMIIILDK